MNVVRDIVGERFGRLVVISRAPNKKGSKNSQWFCKCDCGSTSIHRSDVLRVGYANSCGCLARETARALLTTHGLSKTSEHSIWHAMRKRCLDKNHPTYQRYGAKGITVCDRWKDSFENFYADMGQRPSKRHSLDRIDNKGHYTPENCRWATPEMQGRNRSNNKIVTIDGVSFTVKDWCRLMEVDDRRPYTMKYWNKRSGIKTIEEAIGLLYEEWLAKQEK